MQSTENLIISSQEIIGYYNNNNNKALVPKLLGLAKCLGTINFTKEQQTDVTT